MNKYGIVLYTDGSTFKSNPGPSGSGIHGYVYEFKPPKKKDASYTSVGYLTGNHKTKLIEDPEKDYKNYLEKSQAYVVNPVMMINASMPLEVEDQSRSTNNYAELMGMLEAMRLIQDYNSQNPIKLETAVIHSDSQYVVNGLNEYMTNWKKNNWKKSDGKSVLNSEVWSELDRIQDQLKSEVKLSTVWVRGHNGDFGNENADRLASIASTKANGNDFSYNRPDMKLDTEDVIDEKTGEIVDVKVRKASVSSERDVHPVFFTRRMIFNPCMYDHESIGSYYNLLIPGDSKGKPDKVDREMGKARGDAALVLAWLSKRDPYIDILIREQYKWLELKGRNTNVIVQGMLDNYLEQATYNAIQNNGPSVIHGNSDIVTNMFSYDDKPLTFVMEPRFLAETNVLALADMQSRLEAFMGTKSGMQDKCVELTDYFYVANKKGRLELNKDITSDMRSLPVPVEVRKGQIVNIRLTFNLDIPPRNALKKFEAYNPKLYLLISEESSLTFSHYTVIHLTTTDDYILMESTNASRRVF